MNAYEKSQKIRELVGLAPRKKGYFVKQEMEAIAKYLELSRKGLVDLQWWADKGRFRMGAVGADDMTTLLSLVTKQFALNDAKESAESATRLVPPSNYEQEEFGVVDVGLTEEETTVVTIFNMLPKAMVEEAIELTIAKSRYDNEDGKKWMVNIDFYRE